MAETATSAFVTWAATDGSFTKAYINSAAIVPKLTSAGQTIEDVIIGWVGETCDVQYHIEFYKDSTPSIQELAVPLNARNTFRWVPVPGREVKLGPTDRLQWRVSFGGRRGPGDVAVYTRGGCLVTGRVIVNQEEWA